MILIAVAVVLAVTTLACWLLWGRPLTAARTEVATWRSENERHVARLAEAAVAERGYEVELTNLRGVGDRLAAAEAARAALAEKLSAAEAQQAERDRQFEERRKELDTQFAALAGRALETAQTEFLKRAEARFAEQKTASEAGLAKNQVELKALLVPVAETLKRYEGELKAIEAARTEAYGGLKEAIDAVGKGQESVRTEAAKLVNALRASPKARGRWGEQQLRNVLEMAGLAEHADFRVEVSVEGDDGRLRPDVIVRLPGGRQLVIDAKCSMNSYIDACDATDDVARGAHLAAHAKALRAHADTLGRKAYWDQFDGTADYVLMFIPGEQFLSGGLEADAGLWEYAFEKKVLLATPTNLVAIARTVAVVWRQEQMAVEAQLIGEMARELYRRLATMGEHVDKIGGNLDRAIKSYNAFVGSLESSVLPQGRKFVDLKVETGAKLLTTLEPVETAVRLPARGRDLGFDAGDALEGQ